jgi:hypothetical protein
VGGDVHFRGLFRKVRVEEDGDAGAWPTRARAPPAAADVGEERLVAAVAAQFAKVRSREGSKFAAWLAGWSVWRILVSVRTTASNLQSHVSHAVSV